MNRKALQLIELLNKAPSGLAVEVGSIREPTENASEGFSTIHLSRECKRLWRTFKSLELDEKNARMANAILASFMLPQSVIQGDGAQLIKDLGPISFLYLDSSRYPGHTFEQYVNAELAEGAIVAVDDCQTFDGHEFGKGQFLVEYLKKHNITFNIHYTSAEWETVYRMISFVQKDHKKSGEIL